MQELLDVDAKDITSRLCLGFGWLSSEASRREYASTYYRTMFIVDT